MNREHPAEELAQLNRERHPEVRHERPATPSKTGKNTSTHKGQS